MSYTTEKKTRRKAAGRRAIKGAIGRRLGRMTPAEKAKWQALSPTEKKRLMRQGAQRGGNILRKRRGITFHVQGK